MPTDDIPFALGAALTGVKRAVSYVSDFEVAVAREARKRGMQGVVCGHIHHAEMREIDGELYCNDGDWVESLTALVEQANGRLAIADWSAQRALVASAVQPAPAAGARSPSATAGLPSALPGLSGAMRNNNGQAQPTRLV